MGGPTSAWSGEAGGHRFQRVPPTEKRGRVHTSTVTVAVVEESVPTTGSLVREEDLIVSWFSGTGKGGQHRNKHQNSCRLLHVPSGISVKSEQRSRTSSYEQARRELLARLDARHSAESERARAEETRAQVGSGMRGDKVRTYRLQDDEVVDHRTGRRARWRDVARGEFDALLSTKEFSQGNAEQGS